ncbi:hypothetical protein GLOTRDRAFT_103948 [Gloeophyllum trabeum ATCC 11539]|uniref:Metaxin glutathione S-transferase domain-containing protein n=1 Tax=Gloeophyllum trabeum (strain ATCC 11539 / FP-39264 / Madison 617) TaxID=670483 RepID=S7RTJ9_GLOTA|nr:uncharacterized protein GLOTRDRAFT_103948 [Gloeophyllum trabeum ATCC 11539]EPQ57985.1 hypothetical protein GLOTRDRAFT_103948 [Gloeophyllum trabeum ATCC 11539]
MSTTTTSLLTLPAPLRTFLASFPLHTYPAIPPPRSNSLHDPAQPTMWIHAPLADPEHNLLSADVECLKWQAHVALRGVERVRVRWDVAAAGGVGGRLPSVWVPGGEGGELIPAHLIPAWVERERGGEGAEGYRDEAARDESRAWVALLEGTVHAALITFHPASTTARVSSLAATLAPPPAPLTGVSSLLPPYGARVPAAELETRYAEAVGALSERLGGDKWFLGSASPTPLDALAFAYIHTLLHTPAPKLRTQVTRRVNLVAWERRVSGLVRAAFVKAGEEV